MTHILLLCSSYTALSMAILPLFTNYQQILLLLRSYSASILRLITNCQKIFLLYRSYSALIHLFWFIKKNVKKYISLIQYLFCVSYFSLILKIVRKYSSYSSYSVVFFSDFALIGKNYQDIFLLFCLIFCLRSLISRLISLIFRLLEKSVNKYSSYSVLFSSYFSLIQPTRCDSVSYLVLITA